MSNVQRWEYKLMTPKADDLQSSMYFAGKEGWEIFSIINVFASGLWMFAKRPLPDEPDGAPGDLGGASVRGT